MNRRLRYELRGLAYWAECANPFRKTVTARQLPLGLCLQSYKRDCVGRGLYRRGVHEPGFTKYLLDTYLDSPGGNFLDIGGNIGYFACLFGKLAGPSGKVVSIEPEPRNLRLLHANIQANCLTNITVHPCAAGSENGTARMGLYKAANRGRHSLIEMEGCEEFVSVPVHRLDDLLNGASICRWSLMKLDVEGFEPFVFGGAAETLARTDSLALEYSPASWKKAKVDPADVFQSIGKHFSRIDRFQGLSLVATSVAECLRAEFTMDLLLRR